MEKKRFLDSVLLTEEEHEKLFERFGFAETDSLIEDLDNYIGSKGRRYKSHYKTILAWAKRNSKKIEGIKACVVCRGKGAAYQLNTKNEKVYLCPDCYEYFNKSGRSNWGRLSLSAIERIVEKNRIAKRPPKPDPELEIQNKNYEQQKLLGFAK